MKNAHNALLLEKHNARVYYSTILSIINLSKCEFNHS